MFTQTVSFPAAFVAGLLSFFSPCVLPLIPAYFTFITGFSIEELTEEYHSKIRWKVFFSTILFVLGFSLVFILLGASASYLGGLMVTYKKFIRIIGGILIIILGIHLTGVIRIPGLDFEKRITLEKKPMHFFGTLIIGMAFGAGWSPCIGPLLGSILIIAGSQETVWQGVMLLVIYSAGLAIPFIMISIFINCLLTFIKKASNVLKYVNVVAGVALVVVGLILVSDKLYVFSG
ncbi:MAG: cytochrome c biogenesis protein CcdA [Deltaproteobacteria bacterium]|jgi:cytochrome c-type biogenesis protein|nr:cytochrome c biogenesis protein CcdA [Deltaproteobacteria bacterium]MBW2491560.1 cytochrome c biogenesis protein CcdA [Deltaproteobacteria bacterium]